MLCRQPRTSVLHDFIASRDYDRPTFIAQCLQLDDFLAMLVYLNIGVVFNAAVANLCVMLRDRGLISRSLEMSFISVQPWLTASFAIYTLTTYGSQLIPLLGFKV